MPLADDLPSGMIAVPVSEMDRSLGLKFHLIRAGTEAPPEAKRCEVCKSLLESDRKRLLCDLHGGAGYKKR
jgi:hypothetical protein